MRKCLLAVVVVLAFTAPVLASPGGASHGGQGGGRCHAGAGPRGLGGNAFNGARYTGSRYYYGYGGSGGGAPSAVSGADSLVRRKGLPGYESSPGFRQSSTLQSGPPSRFGRPSSGLPGYP